MARMMPLSAALPLPSLNSAQPTSPASVVIFRNEK
jgi:hypothetical protein